MFMKFISMMMIQTDGGRTSIDTPPLFRENGCIASLRRTVVVEHGIINGGIHIVNPLHRLGMDGVLSTFQYF
jgi:hypothetical protein